MSAAGSQKRAVNPRGLSRPAEPEGGELIAYATRENDVADDGDGAHSPFTEAFLAEIVKPGVEVNLLFRRVRSAVLRATNKTQDPAIYQSLPEDSFYFRPPLTTPAPGKPEAQPPMSEAARAWADIKDFKDVAVFEAFRRQYGADNALYDALAKQRIEELKRAQLATIAPAKPAAAPQKPAEEACDGLLVSVALSGETPCIKPGSGVSFKDCPDCPEMVVVPSGSFMMGSPKNEPEHQSSEEPQHNVTIAEPFVVGRFAVTFAEWDACANDGGCGSYLPLDQGEGRAGRPVINVSWNDAKSYVEWLSKKTGRHYRLLSEAEREYVTRAGKQTPFWWGASITPQQTNYNGNYTYNGGQKGEFRQKTLPVNSFKPNPWGIYQVHGNVWEWTEDCWNDNYNGAPQDGSARTTADCTYRVLRGGSWYSIPGDLRAARRYWGNSGDRYFNNGFRVARTF
jgi:formylglycine-generating enzyme required for sulfatase activity